MSNTVQSDEDKHANDSSDPTSHTKRSSLPMIDHLVEATKNKDNDDFNASYFETSKSLTAELNGKLQLYLLL